MMLSIEELAWIDAATRARRLPPALPALPGLTDTPTTPAMLIEYRRARLGRPASR